SGIDLTYAPSTITTQQPTEGELDLLFEAMYDDFIGGQPSRTVPAAQAQQVRQTSTTSTSIAKTAPTPTNSSSQATNFPNTLQDVDGLNSQQPAQQQRNQNVKEAMTDPTWIESMQEELLKFKRLDHDEEQTVIRNKSRLVMRGYRQEEGIDFEESFAPAKLTEKHLKEVKKIFRYLRVTVNTGLCYSKDFGFELTGFSDADYAGCKDTFKSTSSGAQFLGKKLVSWSSKKQDCTALSTVEAEYVSISACCAQVLWMRTQLTDYGFHFNKIPIYYDLKSAIAISRNLV
nr:uncharacterized mitochondrial protein AtMg00810-like [Tanacetum cinerariifolium]